MRFPWTKPEQADEPVISTESTCGQCAYFHLEAKTRGVCRRYPEAVIVSLPHSCGEYTK